MQHFPLFGEVTLEQWKFHTRTAKFDLTLEILTTPEGCFLVSFEYNTGLFDTATIERMGGHLNPESHITSNNLIYMIYTSSSIGKPKGTMNVHQALVNRLLWIQDAHEAT